MSRNPQDTFRNVTERRARGARNGVPGGPPARDGARVLPFRRPGTGLSADGGTPQGDAAQRGCASTVRPLREWPAVTAWCVFAWCVAATRLRLAAVRHEVFGVDATLAFLVAVVLPLVCAKSIVRAVKRHLVRVMPASSRTRTPSQLS
jgi:hypothetical protein